MERDDDSKKELIEGLKKAAQGISRTKTARLREIFDEVEAAKDSGLSLKTIVAVLADRGLIFDLATFVNTRQRIKRERVSDSLMNNSASTMSQVEVTTTPHIKKSTSNHSALDMNIKTTESQKETMPREKLVEKELKRPPGITDARWSQMQSKEFTYRNNK